jgi:hypothetical protein
MRSRFLVCLLALMVTGSAAVTLGSPNAFGSCTHDDACPASHSAPLVRDASDFTWGHDDASLSVDAGSDASSWLEEELDEAEEDSALLHDPSYASHVPTDINVLESSTTDEDVADVRVTMCALDWVSYRASPSVLPFYDDLVKASGCEVGSEDERGRPFVTTLGALEAAHLLSGCTGAGTEKSDCEPSGVLFHQTRVGSTLLANMIGSMSHTLMFSEPQPPQSIVRARRVSFDVKVRYLRVIAAAMGRPIRAHAADAANGVTGWAPSAMYIKTQHTSVLWGDAYRAAFPSLPWAFVHRDPTEVLMSLIRSSSSPLANASVDEHLSSATPANMNSSTPCLRSRLWGPVPGFIAQAARAHDPDWREPSVPVLNRSALSTGDGRFHLLPPFLDIQPEDEPRAYRQLGKAAVASVETESWCALDLAHVAAAALKHAADARALVLKRAAWLAMAVEKHGISSELTKEQLWGVSTGVRWRARGCSGCLRPRHVPRHAHGPFRPTVRQPPASPHFRAHGRTASRRPRRAAGVGHGRQPDRACEARTRRGRAAHAAPFPALAARVHERQALGRGLERYRRGAGPRLP